MVIYLTMSAKLATPDLFKIKIFQSKVYNVIISDYDVANKISLRDSNHIVYLVIGTKFGNSSISRKEVIIISIL